MRLQKVVDIICKKAGWHNPVQSDVNTVTIALAEGVTLGIFVPADEKIIFFSELLKLDFDTLPHETLEKCAQYSLAHCKASDAVLSLQNNALVLHQDVSLVANDAIANKAKCFLNDVTRWKKFILAL